jgi:hypothetical protein
VDSGKPSASYTHGLSYSFCMHNISKRDEQNILNLELLPFRLKCNVSSNQLTILDFFVKKSYLDTGILK